MKKRGKNMYELMVKEDRWKKKNNALFFYSGNFVQERNSAKMIISHKMVNSLCSDMHRMSCFMIKNIAEGILNNGK